MSPELMQEIPQETVVMFQRTSQIISDIDIQPLTTYRVEVKGDSIYLDRENVRLSNLSNIAQGNFITVARES